MVIKNIYERDKISHLYFGINYEIAWKVVKERLPEIKPAIEKLLKDVTWLC